MRFGDEGWNRYNRQGEGGVQSFNIVEIIPQVDLHILKAGDTVELASGVTKEVRSVEYSPSKASVKVLFTTCLGPIPWFYERNGALRPFAGNSIVKIIPKPKLDFSMNAVDLTTLKEGDTVHLSNRQSAEVVSIARKMLGTIYLIRLRNFALNYYCVDGCSLDKDKPSIVRIAPQPSVTDKLTAKAHAAKILFQERLELLLAQKLAQSQFITPFVTVRATAATAAAVRSKPIPLTIGGHVVKSGDVLTRVNGDQIVVDKVNQNTCGDWRVWHSSYGGCFFTVDNSGRCQLDPSLSIAGVTPKQTIPSCRWPGFTAACTPQGQPSIRMTLERLTQPVEQRPSAFTEIAQLTGMSVTDLLSDLEKGSSVAWPKPITTPPTKKDADPFGQVAVFDKDTDWMKQEWWAARDMLAAGDIAGWAHTQAWHDASDPWN